MYSEEFIERVRSNTNIQRVFEAKGITLHKSGADLVCKCPFHADKSPSLHVNVSKGLWNCFGCGEGGDAIQFVRRAYGYSFREAVEHLANAANIPIEQERQLTQAEIEEQHKREVLLNAMDVVADFYVTTLWDDKSEEAKKALEVASDRWDKEFLQQYRIGYAPNKSDALIQYAYTKGISAELLLELGMAKYNKKGKLADAFRGRIMIPIRNRSGRYVAFTGRTLSTGDDIPKYLNNTATPLFDKDTAVFGLDVAAGPAIRADVMYLVEGAPDVLRLHLIGVKNTVACLGSAWTENQLRMLKHCTTKLCFIPDADPPNQEATNIRDKHGIGIQAVIKNAKKALSLGFSVMVKEIPVGESHETKHTKYFKQDPDSYFVSMDRFNATGEKDFIIWYAGKILNTNQAASANAKAIDELAELIAEQDIESQIPVYIDALHEIYPGRQTWKKAIDKAIGEHAKQSLSKVVDGIDILSEFGFVERHNAYYTSSNGATVKWSNFTLVPLFHVRDNNSALRLYRMKNEDGVELTIEFQQEELTSLARFRAKVESQGNFVWLVGESQLTKLKQFLYKATETAELIKQLGWNQRGFYAFGNGIAFHGSWYKVDTLGIVRLPENMGNYYLPAFSEVHVTEDGVDNYNDFDRRFIHDNRSTVSLHEYTSKMVAVFGNKAIVGICFYLATLFRDIILREVSGFPILNLFGPKGSGKTELGHSLMAFFMSYNKAPNLTTSTLPTIAEAVGQVANALIHLDEFKNNLDTEKFEFLKGLWDSVGRSRMNLDTGKKRETSKVNCGVIVSGQELASRDIALFSRFVFLSFDTSQFSKEQLHEMEQFREIRKRGCSHLTLDIIKLRPQFEQGFQQTYYDVTNQLSKQFEDAIEGRILGNWAIIIAAFKTLENYLNLPFDYTTVYGDCCALMEVQNMYCRENNEIAKFWKTLSLLVNKGILYEGCDFHIKYMDKILLKVDSKTNTTRSLECVKPVLIIRNTVFDEYKDYCVSHNESYLSAPSLRQYLKASKDYIGTKAKEAFTPMINGQPIYQEKSDKQGVAYKEKARYVGEALCFDYSMTCELYEFSLASTNIMEESADDDGE